MSKFKSYSKVQIESELKHLFKSKSKNKAKLQSKAWSWSYSRSKSRSISRSKFEPKLKPKAKLKSKCNSISIHSIEHNPKSQSNETIQSHPIRSHPIKTNSIELKRSQDSWIRTNRTQTNSNQSGQIPPNQTQWTQSNQIKFKSIKKHNTFRVDLNQIRTFQSKISTQLLEFCLNQSRLHQKHPINQADPINRIEAKSIHRVNQSNDALVDRVEWKISFIITQWNGTQSLPIEANRIQPITRFNQFSQSIKQSGQRIKQLLK